MRLGNVRRRCVKSARTAKNKRQHKNSVVCNKKIFYTNSFFKGIIITWWTISSDKSIRP
jgi:hypothetical protein